VPGSYKPPREPPTPSKRKAIPIMANTNTTVQTNTATTATRGGYYCATGKCATVSTCPGTCACGMPLVAR
jgi:hypothetical protein